MRSFRLTLKSVTLKDLKLKVEIWDQEPNVRPPGAVSPIG